MQYSSVSADTIYGAGSFVLNIRLPSSMSEPGEHTVSVSIKERPSEEAFINTLVEVGSVIKVFSPYPGLYGELSLSVPNGNINDKIPVELHVINRGEQMLNLNSVYVDFVSSRGNIVKTMNFTPVEISFPGDRYFRKYLDTQGMDAGNYVSIAYVSYSDVTREVNRSFRIGSLAVNITNYTNSIVSDGIQKFYVTLESLWNSYISGVYVDINISNNLGEQYIFRTPSVDIGPWEKKTIESYFDTENLKGNYTIVLNASYGGKSTTIYGNLSVIEKVDLLVYSIIALVILLLLVLIFFVVRHFLRRKNK